MRLSSRRVLRPDGSLRPGTVTIDGATIVAVDAARSRAAAGRTLAPGFVDLQVNGIGASTSPRPPPTGTGSTGCSLAQGVTTWCPTLVTDPLGRYAGRWPDRSAAGEARPATVDRGAHLEGPFLGGAPGAHPPGARPPHRRPAWVTAPPRPGA